MIMKTEFLNRVKDFGLNSYEGKLWCALLSRGVSTAGELSDIAGVPRSRSYDVLESLERKGFIITKLGKPFKYLAVSPSEVIERVKKNVNEEAQNSIANLNNIKTTQLLEDLELLHSTGVESIDPTELSGYIKTRSGIHNHIGKMLKDSQKDFTISCSAAELIKIHKSLEKNFSDAQKNKIDIKALIPSYTEKQVKDLDKVKKHCNIKIEESEIHRFALSDNQQLLFMLQDDSKVHSIYDTGIWIHSTFLGTSFSGLFAKGWKTSKSL